MTQRWQEPREHPGRDAPLDALLPAEMAKQAERVGVTKTQLAAQTMFVLAVLAGAFISLGAMFANVATAGVDLDFGLSRLLGGFVFSLGLVLVVVGGAELFTGNAMIVMAWANRGVRTSALLRNWAIVFAGNALGAIATAVIVVYSGHMELGDGLVGDNAMRVADAKVQLSWTEAFLRGVLANALVCLAVWLSFAARSLTDRVFAVMLPIAAFVAAGFEHSVANLYIVPTALILKSDSALGYWDVASEPSSRFGQLSWRSFVVDNLVPVTAGNIFGGAVLVAVVYWFVYLRRA